MKYSNFDEVYNVIKIKGPLSFQKIVEFIAYKKNIAPNLNYLGEFIDWPHNSEIAGYVGNLSKKGLIENTGTIKSKIRKPYGTKKWK